MSVIRADAVGPSAGGTTRSLVRGTAAAWVNFNGTGTIAARDSENVSSLTDNGPGNYTVNLTNNMSNANYAVSLGVGNAIATAYRSILLDSSFIGAGGFKLNTTDNTFNVVDENHVFSSLHGDLA